MRPARPAWAVTTLSVMQAAGMTREELATSVGLTTRALNDRLSGRVRPLTSDISGIAATLDLATDQLVTARPDGWPRRREPDVSLLTARDRNVYAAAANVVPGPPMRTVGEVQSYVDGVMARPWWRRSCPETSYVRVAGGGRGRHPPAWHESAFEAEGLSHVLHVPRWARRPLTVLHELAHVAVEPILWARPHGPQFVRAWLDLVGESMEPDAAQRLAVELAARRIRPASRARLARDRQRGLAAVAEMLGLGLHGGRGTAR